MSLNSHVRQSTVVAALGGLCSEFDTVVISGTTSALKGDLLPLEWGLGFTVGSALSAHSGCHVRQHPR